SMNLYSDLSWLPRVPSDFPQLCRSVLERPEGLGEQIRLLASSALDQNQLMRLAKVIAKARSAGLSLEPLTPFRLALISNSTTDFIVPALTATAARYGIALECTAAAYDQAVQASLSGDSPIYQSAPQAVLIALDWRGVPLRPTPGDSGSAHAGVQGVVD